MIKENDFFKKMSREPEQPKQPEKPEEMEEDDELEENYKMVEKLIKKISTESARKNIKNSPDNKELTYLKENEKFIIERITSTESPDIEGMIEMTKGFDPREVEPMDSILEGITLDEHRYLIAKNEKGEVASYVQGSYLDIMPESGEIEESEEAVLFFGYCLTKDKFRRKRLLSELVKNILISFLEKARAQGQELKGIIVEAYDKAQPLFNSLGLRRVYFKNEEGKIEEVPYSFPPMDWDRQAGKPIDPVTGKIGEGDPKSYGAPEHLMVKLFDGRKKFDTEELLAMVSSIYEENHILYEREGEVIPQEAKELNRSIVDSFKNDLEEALKRAKNGELLLLSKEEYEKIIKK